MGYKLWIGTNEGKDCPYKEPKEKRNSYMIQVVVIII